MCLEKVEDVMSQKITDMCQVALFYQDPVHLLLSHCSLYQLSSGCFMEVVMVACYFFLSPLTLISSLISEFSIKL